MSPAQISFAESALSDLAGIQERCGDEGVPEVGHRFVAKIFERVEARVAEAGVGVFRPNVTAHSD